MTLGGKSMTRQIYDDKTLDEVYAYYIVTSTNGLSGTQTLSITRGCSGGNAYDYEIYAIANANTSTPIRSSNSSTTGAGGTQSVALTTQSGDLVLSAQGNRLSYQLSVGCGQTSVVANSIFATGYVRATSSSTTVCWSSSSSAVIGALAVRN
jgi:hypothetical protein